MTSGTSPAASAGKRAASPPASLARPGLSTGRLPSPSAAPLSRDDDPAARGWLELAGVAPPRLASGDIGYGKATFGFQSSRAHVYAWGPRTGSWGKSGGWQVRFEDLFATGSPVRSTATGHVPWADVEAVSDLFGPRPSGGLSQWHAVRDPGGHAALVAVCRAQSSPCQLFSAVEGESPEVLPAPSGMRRPLSHGAVRIGRRWYFLVDDGSHAGFELWRADVEEVAAVGRIRRIVTARQSAPAQVMLARRSEGAGLALVVELPADDLQPARVAEYAIHEIDPSTAAVDFPRRIGLESLGPKARRCEPDDDGWLVELTPSTPTKIELVGGRSYIDAIEYRLRLDSLGSCVETIAGRAARGVGVDPSVGGPAPLSTSLPVPIVLYEPGRSDRHVLSCVAP